MNNIQKIKAREILDSRGNPTIELEMVLDNGMKAWSSVPSGASTGEHEAYELRDGGTRLGGKGVQNAINNIHDIIAPALIGMDPREQKAIDNINFSVSRGETIAFVGPCPPPLGGVAVANINAQGLFDSICPKLVGNSADILDEILA